jgi:hypothetical protein
LDSSSVARTLYETEYEERKGRAKMLVKDACKQHYICKPKTSATKQLKGAPSQTQQQYYNKNLPNKTIQGNTPQTTFTSIITIIIII